MTFLLLAFMLINFLDKAVLGLAAKPIMHDLGLSPSEYGLLSSGFYFLFSLSAILVGFASDRVPTKWLLMAMAVVWALTMLPVLAPVGFGVLLASRVVLGAAEGPANPVAMHAVHKWFPNEKRSLPTALLNVGPGIGVALASPLLVAVIAAFGWRWAFVSLFAVGVAWALLWAVFGKEGGVSDTGAQHGSGAPAAVAEEPRIPYRRILLSGTWLGGFVGAFAAYWALALLIAWVPPYLETVLGYSASTTGTLVVLPWIATAVFNLGQGVLTQWLMRRGVSSRMARGVLGGTGILVAGIAMVLFPLAPEGGLQLALLTVAFSLGGILFAIGVTVTSEITPARQRGSVLSITVGIVTTAGLLAPYVTGLVIEAAPDPAAGYDLAFTGAGVLMLIGGLLAVIFVHPERDARRLGRTHP
ncbi:MFS transporter [Streptomyces sp. NBC_01016]|uniref:MFS transporter n=1 Tax=Streptomyces sp. NBC_01016 TaxID=2903720 RepID=UPI0022566387|nr:MFS transporter [Streptomyces sp. NBC_01016]MCX4835085.1 MFS transporter [Streptomyces sp. NBC_01016]